ncbi:facilitated trehalose transporter Tret1-like [Pectinophora gossypiella]|uniref:facilitated trehalose transporter Tret1-like n=1 Tax=Pectinophora gossypiella TaxID=13191 RepID=UPI00214E65BE|nr:facilitated trehalose transporter Tret1-like [Pectinophora gossypiella]
MGILNQVLGTGIACYICMTMGIMFAWPSCTLNLFQSANTTLSRPMSDGELSLFGSLSCIGALISTPLTGFMLDRVGRKYCAVASAATHVMSWSLIAFCSQVEVVLFSIFLCGVGGAVVLIVPVFIGEICQESIRGAMTSGSMVFYAIGMLLSYLLGGILEYKTMVYVCMSLSVVGLLLLTALKETPMFLMIKGLDQEAAKSFAFYRNAMVDSKEVLQEMEKLRRAFNPDLDEENTTPEEEKLKVDEKPVETEKPSLWQFVKKSRSTRQAMFVTLTLITAAVFQGLVVLQVYAEPLFQEAVPNISSTVCSVLLALVTIIAGFIAAYLTDFAGRRPLLIYSSFASGLCCVVLGSQLHLHWAPHWVTAVVIYLFTTVYSLGPGTVPFLLVAEVFLPEVKSFMSMFVIEWAWFCNFIILFIFNPLVSAIGLGPVFYLFAGVCAISTVFSVVYLPETKGLPVDQIQAHFVKKR